MSTAESRAAQSVADIIAGWQRLDPTAPRLTWYGPGDERVELSGRVLANWAVKAANLLAEEADAGEGSVVGIALPVHWRGLVWVLGAWLTGAEVWLGAVEDAPEGMDALITDRPDDVAVDAGVIVAVALPALAMAYDGDLPAGAIDGAADLMTQPDVLVRPEPVAPESIAIGHVRHGGLATWALGTDAPAGPARALVTPTTSVEVLRRALGPWLRGGSVVLVGDRRDEAGLAHVAEVEGVSA